MSVLAMAEITISFERDIASVHRFYKISASSSTPADWTSSQVSNFISQGTIVSGWSLTEPAYDNSTTNSLYFFDLTVFSDDTYNKSNISKSSSYEAAKQAYEEALAAQYGTESLAAKVKNYWWDSTGAHIASGVLNSGETEPQDVTEGTPSTYGFNSLVGLSSLTFGYNSYKALELDGSNPSLKFYKPSKTAQGAQTAILNSNGLVLSEGGIEAGTKSSNNYIYIYSKDDSTNHNLSINNSGNKSDWRIIAGNKFGVDKAGNLYASNATISGTITVGSGSNVYTKTESDGNYDASGSASAAQAAAISAAATDATNKANAVNDALELYKTATNSTLTSLQNQVDGQVEVWYYDVDPTTSNPPAASWNTDTIKARHDGDLYYNIDNGHSWRWLKSGSTYGWQQIPDSDAAAALAKATNAETLAGNKRRIFTSQPTPPYDIGDLWVTGSQIKYCSSSKASGQSYASSDWTLTATDDTKANSAVYEEQYIYISKSSGTTSVSQNTTWVTRSDDVQNTWTTKRPTYSSSYPVLFIAKQKKTLSQSSGTTCTCSTPVKDDTTTVIDGGHITTGTIDAARLNVNDIISSGSIVVQNDISNMAEKDDIPTKVSDLSNDSGFQNATQVESTITGKGYQTASDVSDAVSDGISNASVSDLSDGSSYSTTSQMNSAIGTATNDMATKTYVGNQGYQTASNVNTIIGQTNVSALNDGSDYTKTANLGGTTAVQNAAKTASNYLGDIDSQAGVTLKAINGTTTANTSTSNYIKINTNGLEIFKGGVSVAQYGDTSVIGKSGSLRLNLLAGKINFLNDTNEPIFSINENSSSTTERNANVAVFQALNEVDQTTRTVLDDLVVSGDVTVTLQVEGDTDYTLESSDYTVTVTPNTSVSIALTSSGVTKVKNLITVTSESEEDTEDEGDSGSGETTTISPGTLSIEYKIQHFDKSLLDMTGKIEVSGENIPLEVINSDWSNSNKTDTFISATLKPSGLPQKRISLGIGSGGNNRGIYDSVRNNWLIYADASNKTLINGSNFNVTNSGKITNTYSIYTSYAGSVRHRVENTTKNKKIDLIAATDGSVGLYNPTTNSYLIRTNASGDTRIHGGAFIIPSSGTATLTRNLEIKNGGDIILTNSTGGIAGRKSSGSTTYTIGYVSANDNVVIGDNNTPLLLRGTNKGPYGDFILNSDGVFSPGGRIYMANNVAIQGRSKNGSTQYNLAYVDTDNYVNLGDSQAAGALIRGIYTHTTGNSANVNVDSTGVVKRYASSSERYKKYIKDVSLESLNPEHLYDIEVKQFKYTEKMNLDKNDFRYNKTLIGFIAEQVYEHYPVAVDMNSDGTCETWNPNYIIPPMLALIQKQKKQIDELEQRVSELEK